MYEHQYGFQNNKSTEHNLTNYIHNALNNNEYCIGLFLGLWKASDVCSHTILFKKLKKYGKSKKAREWFTSYLHDRQQKVDIKEHISVTNTITMSVLQGSRLRPILFLIYINVLYHDSKLFKLMFADDTSW